MCVSVCVARFESFSTIVFKNIFNLLWGILVLFGKRVHDQINHIFFTSAFDSQRSFTYNDIMAF